MAKMWVVFKREFLERVRSKWFLIAPLLGPVFLGLVMVLPIVLAAKTTVSNRLSDVIIIDATSTDLGDRVAKYLEQTSPDAPRPRVKHVKAEQIAAQEDSATKAVIDHDAVGYAVLDANTLGGRELKYAGRNATALIDVETITRLV